LRALAEDFLESSEKKYAIAWYQDISVNTLQQLKNGRIDIALVYEKNQGDEAQKEGWAKNYTPIFNDHFLIVGPKKNSAKIETSDSEGKAFLKIARMGDEISAKTFLSRDDNSGTNVKEKSIWESIDLEPWSDNSSWYFKHPVFPRDALIYANEDELYTITDWGTWLSNKEDISSLQIFLRGGKTLLNTCFALTGKNPSPEAAEFLKYLKSERAQNLIEDFGKEKFGKALFTKASQEDFKFESDF
jgi:tungstate transport system substrate-binding protein